MAPDSSSDKSTPTEPTPDETSEPSGDDLSKLVSEDGPEPSTAIDESSAPATPVKDPKPASSRLRWFDILIFAALAIMASVGFWRHAVGDLYSDEADYALASVRGFDANRWDRSDIPREPNRLVAARHFHAPLTVDLIMVAHRFGADDRTIRMPFIAAGGLAVGVVYLCGLALFDRRREVAIGCALLTAIAPPITRMASHALPWSPIILELLLLLWCLAEYTRGRHWGWIAALFGVMATLFVTSEMFFVAAPAVILAAPFLFWSDVREVGGRQRLARGSGIGLALFAAVAIAVWPSGLTGDAVSMLRHYIQMRHSGSFPVNVGQEIFAVAPKWSYVYWYWNDYKPFAVCYAAAVPAIIALAVFRRLHVSLIPLVLLSAFLMFAAHRAHIIGPEYLAHCLPFLTLLGGYAVYAIGHINRPLGIVLVMVIVIPMYRWTPRKQLPGMDDRAQISRWPAASHFLGPRWHAGDKIVVGSQPVSVGHWYLVYQGGAPALDTQFQTMPVHEPRPAFLDRLRSGFYRYVAVSNMVEDNVDLDAKTRRILRDWPVIWRSDEHETGPSRLVIYEASDRHTIAAPEHSTLNRR